jgi:flagellar biosynthesis/type III secretory pathway chaperone
MSTKQLAERIRQKHDVLAQLLQLGRQQARLVCADDVNNLLTLLTAKQSLLNQLQTIERHLEPFRRQDPERRVWATPGERTECADLVRRCESLLAEIVQVERQSEEEMVRRRDAVAARLEETGSATEARKAYLPPIDSQPGRLDLCSESK